MFSKRSATFVGEIHSTNRRQPSDFFYLDIRPPPGSQNLLPSSTQARSHTTTQPHSHTATQPPTHTANLTSNNRRQPSDHLLGVSRAIFFTQPTDPASQPTSQHPIDNRRQPSDLFCYSAIYNSYQILGHLRICIELLMNLYIT